MIGPDGRREIVWNIPCEVPIALIYNDLAHAVMMATPCDLEDFAHGFSIAEGIVNSGKEISDLTIYPLQKGIEIKLSIPAHRFERLKTHRTRRAHMGRSGCGLCGIDNLDDAIRPLPRLELSGEKIPARSILEAAGALDTAQPQHTRNHTVHGAAWVSPAGKLSHIREDIGRHNALDKMIGARARKDCKQNEGFALVSSRCTFELVQKAALARIPILASLSAPSEAAIETAGRCHLTLVSLHANNSQCVIFTTPERIGF
jgi:FdhD protein